MKARLNRFLVLSLVVAILAIPLVAFARHISAVGGGHPSSVGGVDCWDASGWFMTNVCPSTQGWVMALPLETGGIKTVSVMAQVLSGGEATCTLNLNGQGSFTVPGTPATITIRSRLQFYAFPQIDAGNGIYFATVTCLASGNSKFRWQGVVYNP